MQVVANREIYNFRRAPGSRFWKGCNNNDFNTCLGENMQNLLFLPSRSDEGFRGSRLVQVVANREIYNFRRVPGSGFWKGVEIKMS